MAKAKTEVRPGGRPVSIPDAIRWPLYVSEPQRAAASARAQAEGVKLTDLVRGWIGDYAAGKTVSAR